MAMNPHCTHSFCTLTHNNTPGHTYYSLCTLTHNNTHRHTQPDTRTQTHAPRHTHPDTRTQTHAPRHTVQTHAPRHAYTQAHRLPPTLCRMHSRMFDDGIICHKVGCSATLSRITCAPQYLCASRSICNTLQLYLSTTHCNTLQHTYNTISYHMRSSMSVCI